MIFASAVVATSAMPRPRIATMHLQIFNHMFIPILHYSIVQTDPHLHWLSSHVPGQRDDVRGDHLVAAAAAVEVVAVVVVDCQHLSFVVKVIVVVVEVAFVVQVLLPAPFALPLVLVDVVVAVVPHVGLVAVQPLGHSVQLAQAGVERISPNSITTAIGEICNNN